MSASPTSSPSAKRARTGDSPDTDDFAAMLFIESILNHAKPIATYKSPGRGQPSPVLWLQEDAVVDLYQNMDDRKQFETLFIDLCKRGFTREDIETLTMTLGFGACDVAFMLDQIDDPYTPPKVLAACIFMRIKKEKELYVELLCSSTKNGMKLLNALATFAGRPNAFDDGIIYEKMTLIAASDRVKELYKQHGFVEYNATDTYQLERALSP